MKRLFKIYITFLRTEWAEQFQYRGAMVVWVLDLALQPIIYLSVWLTVADSQGGQVGSFSKNDLAAYYIAIMIVNVCTYSWMEISYWISFGALSPMLLQPLHPIHRELSMNISYKLLNLLALLPLIIFLYMAFDPHFNPPMWSVIASIFSLIFAFIIRFIIEWTIGLLAFWFTDVSGFQEVYLTAIIFLTGRMAPLELMPQWIQVIASILPFRWVVSFPVELLLGRLTFEEAINGFMIQVAWIVGSIIILSLVWSKGIKRYSAVGA